MTRASGHAVAPQAGAQPLARYRSEFPIFRDRIYLNTCSLGALGQRTRRRVAAFLDEWQARGAPAWYDTWWDALGELRTRYERLIERIDAMLGHPAHDPHGDLGDLLW